MTQLSLPSGDYLAVVVPVDATYLYVHDIDGITKLVFSSAIQDPLNIGGDMIRLPGLYDLLGRFRDITEETAAGIVEEKCYCPHCGFDHFADYEDSPDWVVIRTALESLASLLRSHGLEPNEIVLLKIKK